MIVAFSVTPLGVGEDVGEYVADAVRVVRESGLPHRTDAMFTSVEGEWDEVMDVVRRAVAAVEARAPRVSLVLKADIRPGVTDGLTSKVETVERYLAAGVPVVRAWEGVDWTPFTALPVARSRWWREAATPNIAWRPRRSACPFRRGCPTSRRP